MSAAGKQDNLPFIEKMGSEPTQINDPVSRVPEDKGKKAFEIEVVDDTPPADKVDGKGRPVKQRDPNKPIPSEDPFADLDPELKKYLDENNKKAQKRIADLTFEFHNERRERESIARERDEAVRVAQQWRQQSSQAEAEAKQRESAMLETQRQRGEGSIQLAQRALAAAIEAGKSEEIARAQTDLARAITQQEMLPPRPVQAPVQQQPQQWQPQPQQWQQPVQQQPSLAQQTAPDPKAVEWLKRNPWFGQDEVMTGAAYGLHERLVKSGVHPQSDEYYNKIDEGMRRVFPDLNDGVAGQQQAAPRPSIVSPPTRGLEGPRKVQLTATQVRLAKRLGLTLEQYAAQLLKEQKENG